MKLPPVLQQRRWVWAVAAALVLAATYWLLREPESGPEGLAPSAPATAPARPEAPAAAARPPESSGPAVAAAPATEQPADSLPDSPPNSVDIFAVRDWEPAPPPAEAAADAPPVSEAPAPPPPPEAPPLPFRYAGKVDEPGQPTVFFLIHGDKVIAVRPGDLIDGTYRVGKLEGGQLRFLYQPMKIRQTLSLESAS